MKILSVALLSLFLNPVMFAQRILSPEVHADRRVTFRLKAPDAKEVSLRAEGTKASAMERGADGLWSVTTEPMEPDFYIYSFLVDGVRALDPGNNHIKYNTFAPENQLHIPGPSTLPWEIADVPHGVIHRHHYRSQIIGAERDLLVYTPPGYEPGAETRYPVLYLLHGYTDAEDTWTSVGRANVILDNLIAQGRAKPMLVVMPYGYGNDGILALGWEGIRKPEAEAVRNASYAKFRESLFGEIIPFVKKSYRTAAKREARAIAGLSMGGAQALWFGLNAPERFAWIGGFSSGGASADFAERFPKAGRDLGKELSLLWIGCGREDRLFDGNKRLSEWLKEKEVTHTWVEKPGGHSFLVWRRFLAEFLPLLFAQS